MGAYVQISTASAKAQSVRALSPLARLLWFEIQAHFRGTSLGLLAEYVDGLARHVGMSATEAEAGLAELSAAGLASVDPVGGCIRLEGWRGPRSADQAKGLSKLLDYLPASHLVSERLCEVLGHIAEMEAAGGDQQDKWEAAGRAIVEAADEAGLDCVPSQPAPQQSPAPLPVPAIPPPPGDPPHPPPQDPPSPPPGDIRHQRSKIKDQRSDLSERASGGGVQGGGGARGEPETGDWAWHKSEPEQPPPERSLARSEERGSWSPPPEPWPEFQQVVWEAFEVQRGVPREPSRKEWGLMERWETDGLPADRIADLISSAQNGEPIKWLMWFERRVSERARAVGRWEGKRARESEAAEDAARAQEVEILATLAAALPDEFADLRAQVLGLEGEGGVESALEGLGQQMVEIAWEGFSEAERDEIRRAVDSSLEVLGRRMLPDEVELHRDRVLIDHIRDRAGLPVLSVWAA